MIKIAKGAEREVEDFIGASIKDAGKICFGISEIEDEKWISELLRRSSNNG